MRFSTSIPTAFIQASIDPDAPLVAAPRINSSWFSPHASAEVTDVSIGGPGILPNLTQGVDYTFALRDRLGNQSESLLGSLTNPSDKRLFRL